MIHVEFDPCRLSGDEKAWWTIWNESVKKAQAEGKTSRGRFSDDIWCRLKKWLLDHVFHHKCAYCESFMDHVVFGDADHYRPKSRVTTKDTAGAESEVQRDGLGHPGYYWIVYHWKNVVPACPRCNGGAGKGTQFPVKKEHVFEPCGFEDPDTLDKVEEPLLLHPYSQSVRPEDHLQFGIKGVIAERNGSEIGRTSIEVLGLGRDDLVRARQRSQDEARRDFFVAAAYGGHELAAEVYRRYQSGVEQHGAAVVASLSYEISRLG